MVAVLRSVVTILTFSLPYHFDVSVADEPIVLGTHDRYAAAVVDPSKHSGFRVVYVPKFGGSSSGPAAAWGRYKEEMNTTGWSWLEVHTNASFNTEHQAVAAGVVEGGLTSKRIDEFLHNTGTVQDFSNELTLFINHNTEWAQQQVQQNQKDTHWRQVGLAYKQLEGLLAGYNAARKEVGKLAVDWSTFYALTLAGDLDDLCKVFACNGRLRQKVQNTSNSHCSALVKVVDGEVFMGHSTWTQFESMTRIYKLYNFAFRHASSPGHAVAFPSYPGITVSIDDFYQTSAGLVVMETTNANANSSLWKSVVPQSLLYWVRVMIANLLADSGPSWATMFARYNSGTYNNQWIVVDTKLMLAPSTVKLHSPLRPHTLTISELLPGHVHTDDMTYFLDGNGYWMSFNRPFFKDVFERSGQPELVKRYGDHYDWNKTARAQIFRRLMPSIADHVTYQRAMRYNNYEHDPASRQGCKFGPSASNAIAERGDLTSTKAGCISDIDRQDEAQIDVKYTTLSLMRKGTLSAIAQSGPTYDDQPAFRWSSSPFANKAHIGQPDLWKFPWVNASWQHYGPSVNPTGEVVIML